VDPAWVPAASMTAPSLLNWSSVSGKVYQVWATTNLSVPFTTYGGYVTASAPSLTVTSNPTDVVRYYKIQLFP
jgi:hypothetical protein